MFWARSKATFLKYSLNPLAIAVGSDSRWFLYRICWILLDFFVFLWRSSLIMFQIFLESVLALSNFWK